MNGDFYELCLQVAARINNSVCIGSGGLGQCSPQIGAEDQYAAPREFGARPPEASLVSYFPNDGYPNFYSGINIEKGWL